MTCDRIEKPIDNKRLKLAKNVMMKRVSCGGIEKKKKKAFERLPPQSLVRECSYVEYHQTARWIFFIGM